MKILFIGNTRIGDFVLSTGLISHLLKAYPDARITLACGDVCAPLTAHIPRLERVIRLRKQRFHGHWWQLWRDVVGTEWDLVIDLRNSLVSYLLRKKRIARRLKLGHLHQVEEMAQLLHLTPPPSPQIWLSAAEREYAASILVDRGPMIGMGPGASHIAKQWPAERFTELAQRLIGADGPYPQSGIILFGAPDETAAARQVEEQLPANRVINLCGQLSLLQTAALLKRCDLWVGNDNGQMHMAAALGIPTFGLFGPTSSTRYGPWGDNGHAIQTMRPYSELSKIQEQIGADAESLMGSLSVTSVLDEICRKGPKA